MYEEGEFHERMMNLHEENQRREREESRNTTYSSRSGSGSNTGSGTGIGVLILIGIIGFVLYKIYLFITANWVSIVTILGSCAASVIICVTIHKTLKRTGLKALFTIITILAAVGIIGAVLYFGPRQTEIFFDTLSQKISGLMKMFIKP
jgi:hypothetical protein